MTSTRRFLGAIALLTALGAVTACGPEESDAVGAAGGDGAASPATGGAEDGDCGKPPTLPAGHTRLKVTLMRDAGGFEAARAKPHCTPNDWIYGADKDAPTTHYVLPENVGAQLALADGPGQWKQVDHDQLALHIDRCLAQEIGAPDDYPKVKAPFGCFGNIYEITLDAQGRVATVKEIWSV
ncbi:hypothetical protein ACFV97_17020 [Streptomyces sp. NPDC059913]|uniref:hypothetical protein n=1 Tax=unclassified Streptomyces TaxID=2593676 RepID=UPI00365678EF